MGADVMAAAAAQSNAAPGVANYGSGALPGDNEGAGKLTDRTNLGGARAAAAAADGDPIPATQRECVQLERPVTSGRRRLDAGAVLGISADAAGSSRRW